MKMPALHVEDTKTGFDLATPRLSTLQPAASFDHISQSKKFRHPSESGFNQPPPGALPNNFSLMQKQDAVGNGKSFILIVVT